MSDQIVSIYKTSAPPFPTAIMAHAYVESMQDSIGVKDSYEMLYNLIKEKSNDWHFLKTDMERLMPQVVDAFIERPSLVAKCRKNYLSNIEKLNQLLDRTTVKQRLVKMTNNELVEFLEEAAALYHLASYYVEPPNFSLEAGGHKVFGQKVKAFLDGSGAQLSQSEFGSYFSSLVNFTEMSFVQEAELSLLKIALLDEADRKRAVAKHEEQFYWQLHDYYGPLLDQATIQKELAPLLGLSIKEVEGRIEKIERTVDQNRQTLESNLKRYPLSDDLVAAAGAIRDFAYLYSDVKKRETSRANVGYSEVIYFLAEQYDLDHFQLRYATQEELIGLIDGSAKVNGQVLQKRVGNSVLACRSGDTYFEFLSDSNAEAVRLRVGSHDTNTSGELKGMSANSGKYIGPARVVINASQISKVEEGDVLVAPHTTVNFVPAMKKAGAIITDIGGITSHAAIVSRELGVPCIVDLKTATTVFKDEDIIEVNANHGMVKKISD